MTTMNTIPITTQTRNKYLYDRGTKKLVLCHPVMHYLLILDREGKDLPAWISSLTEKGITIDNCGPFSKETIFYYFQKYSILKENGYFQTGEKANREKLVFKMKAEDVRHALANTPQVTFEVTDRCGLDCRYCGFGAFYDDYDKRQNTDLPFKTAQILLDYLVDLWNSPLNLSHHRNIYIGFYGGEPLLNFPFIRQMTDYVSQLNTRHNRFTFSMTTNGLLLDRYMDFLVEKDFNLLISLDGDEAGNGYRIHKNGKLAFPDIMKNVELLKTKHPRYFKEKVNFNAVLHNLNSVSRIYHFFKKTFDKIPGIAPLNTSGIAENQKKAFWKTYANIEESLYQSEDYSMIEKEMFINLPTIRALSLFIHRDNDFVFDDYNRLIYPSHSQSRFPTGTCTPFSKKVFLTVNGKILPCERIGHAFMLGSVTEKDGVKMDFTGIAQKYSDYFSKLENRCSACRNADNCSQCIFNLENLENKPVCSGFSNQADYSRQIASCIDYIEDNPGVYGKILEEVITE